MQREWLLKDIRCICGLKEAVACKRVEDSREGGRAAPLCNAAERHASAYTSSLRPHTLVEACECVVEDIH